VSKTAESRNDPNFSARLDAAEAGHLQMNGNSLSLLVGQRIRSDGTEEIWGSVVVSCDQREDGSLLVSVTVFHPDWDEGRQVALIESRAKDREALVLQISCEGM
jgi:hypothetical protein